MAIPSVALDAVARQNGLKLAGITVQSYIDCHIFMAERVYQSVRNPQLSIWPLRIKLRRCDRDTAPVCVNRMHAPSTLTAESHYSSSAATNVRPCGATLTSRNPSEILPRIMALQREFTSRIIF